MTEKDMLMDGTFHHGIKKFGLFGCGFVNLLLENVT